eukprot:GHUV01023731.1.p1 GENE.GHUV01023731.1~~GHUV01023731.1.p1  ORF type:complete len:107 (-),score=16.28 GHUV01023731.1:1362-1682(-)
MANLQDRCAAVPCDTELWMQLLQAHKALHAPPNKNRNTCQKPPVQVTRTLSWNDAQSVPSIAAYWGLDAALDRKMVAVTAELDSSSSGQVCMYTGQPHQCKSQRLW